MKLFIKKISFVSRLCIILNKIRTKQTSPHAFFKIVGFMHWNCHYSFIMQKQRSVITQVQKIYLWDLHVYIWKLIQFFFTYKLCVSFVLLSFFVQNKIKVIIPMTLRENAISVCCCFFKSTYFNTNFFSPLYMHFFAIDVVFFNQFFMY